MLAITRRPSPELVLACNLTFVSRRPISFPRAAEQHRGYVAALRDLGVDVLELPALDGLPDATFVEDTAVVLPEVAVIGRSIAPGRGEEGDHLEPELARRRPVLRIAAAGTLEGGDVLRVGRRLFVGLTSRTNARGADALREAVAPYGYDVIGVPVRGALHLKTACTAVSARLLLLNPTWVDPAAFPGLATLAVDPDEPFAANVLRLDDARLLASASFPRTAARLRDRGLRPVTVEVDELEKAEAGVTCLSLVLDPAAIDTHQGT